MLSPCTTCLIDENVEIVHNSVQHFSWNPSDFSLCFLSVPPLPLSYPDIILCSSNTSNESCQGDQI